MSTGLLYPLEIVKDKLKEKGYKILNESEYIGLAIKINIENEDGYRFYARPSQILGKQNKTPQIFARINPFTEYNVRLWIKLNNKPYKLISMDVNNISGGEIKIICPKHGEVITKWFNIRDSYGCPLCGDEIGKVNMKKNVDEIKQIFIENGYEPMFTKDDYKGATSYLTAKTKEGYKIYTPYSNVSGGQVSFFYASNIYTLENIKLWMKLNNSPYKLISKEYISAIDDMILECPKHGQFTTNWNRIKSGNGCRKCADEALRGENHPHWNGGTSRINHAIRWILESWKKDSLINAHYFCNITHKQGQIEVHHIYGFKLIMEEALNNLKLEQNKEINFYDDEDIEKLKTEVLNLHNKYGYGAVLLLPIHKLYHAKYGNNYNTEEQFNEFKENYHNGLYDNELEEKFKSYNNQYNKAI